MRSSNALRAFHRPLRLQVNSMLRSQFHGAVMVVIVQSLLSLDPIQFSKKLRCCFLCSINAYEANGTNEVRLAFQQGPR